MFLCLCGEVMFLGEAVVSDFFLASHFIEKQDLKEEYVPGIFVTFFCMASQDKL